MNRHIPGSLPGMGLMLLALMTGCSSQLPTPVAQLLHLATRRSATEEARRSSYVVLLPSPDGSVGRVMVTGKRGEQVLTRAQQGTWLDGSGAPSPWTRPPLIVTSTRH